ncbi:MAG: hypothetical protein WCE52_06275 [Candidatus Acidiferrum sp.]
MTPPTHILPCDGCGQLAAPEHFAARLARLEQATRYRPLHIQTLLLSAFAPAEPTHFLYAADGPFEGEAAQLLSALEISTEGKPREAVLTEFQKRGLLLTHIMECPPESNSDTASLQALLASQVQVALVRIRRSLKPKRVVVISHRLDFLMPKLNETSLGCHVALAHLDADADSPNQSGSLDEHNRSTFRQALAASGVS